MEAVYSVVDSGVYRMCSGANKCVMGSLGSAGDEVKTLSKRMPYCDLD